jgi:hypothetical protein
LLTCYALQHSPRPRLFRVIGHLPPAFDTIAAYGDLATGLLAMLALLTVKVRPLFWLFVVAFNLAGVADLFADYYNAVQLGVPQIAGEFGSTYWIPIIYVPILMITNAAAFYSLVRRKAPLEQTRIRTPAAV